MTESATSPFLTVKIKHWNAWLPGVYGQQACAQWAQGHKALVLGEGPDVSAVPAMLRRRLSGVGRVAAAVVWDLVPEASSMPMVFCSQHGDQDRTLQLLDALGRQEALSPAAFSMSVHNAVAGVLSIAKKAKGAMTALAADEQLLSMGLIEAWGQLQSADEVLLVIYDLPLPEVYQHTDNVIYPYALAMVLSRQEGSPIALGSCDKGSDATVNEPEAVQWLRWFANPHQAAALVVPGQRCCRVWRK
ncbi:beta-ketoacyl synthase chain length factor [Simiduia curdlanivorans]|uniref:Beta-ketoacyl synthase chain length factor n=1 Tax=Simiduia curdlanivorans TaxID=1492769 RepID=A0ABV8V4Z3_9GAMM|nr:beta-ketoacyl synthase chain length factor [Simiduia curdlanivorans]MDN3640809.1 beta-ketoacyl synthase chain length factor [Simiduia curdlanivorans]